MIMMSPPEPVITIGGIFQEQNVAVQSMDGYSSSPRSVKNYASSKIFLPQAESSAQVMDQKYERVATLSSQSKEYDQDLQKLNSLEKELGAVVQQEKSSGLSGARKLDLTLGVVPSSFEPLVDRLKTIGSLNSVTVNKTDKTSEFKALAAKRLSLEKTRDGLRSLKAPGADLADLITLETRILEIESQIQDLGVSLGDFDESNSLCTVEFTLNETTAAVGPNILYALLEALAWTVPLYLGIVLAAFLVMGTGVLTTMVIDRIKKWRAES